MNQENCQYEDLSSLHYYRTELPNILPQLDMDVYEIATYYIIKMAAGDKGACFKSNSTLCATLKIGKEKFIEVKKSLERKGLIRITKRKNANGSLMPDLIQIIDLWPLNMQELQKIREENQKKQSGGGVVGENQYPNKNPAAPQDEKGVVGNADQGSRQRRQKQEPFKKNHFLEQQQQIDKSACDPPPTVSISAVVSKTQEKKKEQPHKPYRSKEVKIYECIQNLDIPQADKHWICDKYDEQCVKNAIEWALSEDIETTLQQTIKYGCKNLLKTGKKRISIPEEISQYFKDHELYNHATCYIDQEAVGFQRGMNQAQVKFKENGFWGKLKLMCEKFGINFCRFNGVT